MLAAWSSLSYLSLSLSDCGHYLSVGICLIVVTMFKLWSFDHGHNLSVVIWLWWLSERDHLIIVIILLWWLSQCGHYFIVVIISVWSLYLSVVTCSFVMFSCFFHFVRRFWNQIFTCRVKSLQSLLFVAVVFERKSTTNKQTNKQTISISKCLHLLLWDGQ